MKNKMNVRENILDIAETLIQTKGYNGFSFRDISEIIGVKTSSIHYHFPTKADLGKAVVQKHTQSLGIKLEQIMQDSAINYKRKLQLFLDNIFASTFASSNKMCLGGMLAVDVLTLPEIIQVEVRIFFNRLEKWLEQLLIQGKDCLEFEFSGDPKNEAELILATIEGSLLLARLYKNENKLIIARRQIENHLF